MDFGFLAVPNIAGMRFIRYVKILAILLMFGVCLFFVVFCVVRYWRKKTLIRQLDTLDTHTLDLQKKMLIQKIVQSSGKTKLVLFIEYLEKFVTTDAYANLWELFASQWFSAQDIHEFERVLYTDAPLSDWLKTTIDQYFTS